MRARALLVARSVHVAFTLRDVIEDDKIELDLLLSISVGGLEGVGAGIADLGLVNDESGRGASLVFVVQDRVVLSGTDLSISGMNPRKGRSRLWGWQGRPCYI